MKYSPRTLTPEKMTEKTSFIGYYIVREHTLPRDNASLSTRLLSILSLTLIDKNSSPTQTQTSP